MTVTWNLLIDYQLRHDRIRPALKLYNEMKKRAQRPNAQTYTIIFRGCAGSSHPRLAVSEAVRIYHTMLSLERVAPNTIHLNAVIKVCAKANDIDSMFTVLETANDGLRSPNNLTYTTILNALRAQVDNDNPKHKRDKDMTEEDLKAEILKTTTRAKAIWEEVISRWRDGQIILDEELVCAMGRILLLDRWDDADSVLDLIEQTMSIAKVGRKEPNTMLRWKLKRAKYVEIPPTDGKAPEPDLSIVPKTTAPGAPSQAYARPGRNSLSLVLQSLEKTGKTRQGTKYWGIFTKNYGVQPDAENWYRLARVFMRGKNSAHTVGYLVNLPAELADPRHFRVGMRTCLRDRLNPSAFAHASQLLETMHERLAVPDLQALRTYLRVAYACKGQFEEMSKAGQFEEARRGFAAQLQEAFERIGPSYRIAARAAEADTLVSGAEGDVDRARWARLSKDRTELGALARKLVATADRLIQGNLIPEPAVAEKIATLRNNLNRFVVAYFEQRLKMDPYFNKDRDRGAGEEDDMDEQQRSENEADEYDEEHENQVSHRFLETGQMDRRTERENESRDAADSPEEKKPVVKRKLMSLDDLLSPKDREATK